MACSKSLALSQDDDLFHRVRQRGLLKGSLCGSSFCERNPTWNGSGWATANGTVVEIDRPPTGKGMFSCQSHERGAVQSTRRSLALNNPYTGHHRVGDRGGIRNYGGHSLHSKHRSKGLRGADQTNHSEHQNMFFKSRWLANEEFMRWMGQCEGFRHNCSTYWRGRDGLNSVRYNVLHRIPVMNNFITSAAEGKGGPQVELHWATVRPGWSPSEWEAERELRLQFTKTFVPVDSWQAANKLEAARTGRPHKRPVLGLEIFGALLAGIVFFAHLHSKQSTYRRRVLP